MNENNNDKNLKGLEYRKYIFTSIILPKYQVYIDSEIDNYFGYVGANKKWAMKIKVDDFIIANIKLNKKENTFFEIFLVCDRPQNLIESYVPQYIEYLDYLYDNDLVIDETHYGYKISLFPDIEKSKVDYDEEKYMPSQNEFNNLEEYNYFSQKMNHFKIFIQNTIIPKLCDMWNNDIETYILKGEMGEEYFENNN